MADGAAVTTVRQQLASSIPKVAKRLYEVQESLYRIARNHPVTAEQGLALAFGLGRDFERLIALHRRSTKVYAEPIDEAFTQDIEMESQALLSILLVNIARVCDRAGEWTSEVAALKVVSRTAREEARVDPSWVESLLGDVKRCLQTMQVERSFDEEDQAPFGRVEMMMDDEERWLAAYGAY